MSTVHNNFSGGMLGPSGMYREIGDKPRFIKNTSNMKVTPDNSLVMREQLKEPPPKADTTYGNICETQTPGIYVLPFKFRGEWYALHYTPWFYNNHGYMYKEGTGSGIVPNADFKVDIGWYSSTSDYVTTMGGFGDFFPSYFYYNIPYVDTYNASGTLVRYVFEPYGLSNFNVFTIFKEGTVSSPGASKVTWCRPHGARTTPRPPSYSFPVGNKDRLPFLRDATTGDSYVYATEVWRAHQERHKPFVNTYPGDADKWVYDGEDVHPDNFNVRYKATVVGDDYVILYDELGNVEPVYFDGVSRVARLFGYEKPLITEVMCPVHMPATLGDPDVLSGYAYRRDDIENTEFFYPSRTPDDIAGNFAEETPSDFSDDAEVAATDAIFINRVSNRNTLASSSTGEVFLSSVGNIDAVGSSTDTNRDVTGSVLPSLNANRGAAIFEFTTGTTVNLFVRGSDTHTSANMPSVLSFNVGDTRVTLTYVSEGTPSSGGYRVKGSTTIVSMNRHTYSSSPSNVPVGRVSNLVTTTRGSNPFDVTLTDFPIEIQAPVLDTRDDPYTQDINTRPANSLVIRDLTKADPRTTGAGLHGPSPSYADRARNPVIQFFTLIGTDAASSEATADRSIVIFATPGTTLTRYGQRNTKSLTRGLRYIDYHYYGIPFTSEHYANRLLMDFKGGHVASGTDKPLSFRGGAYLDADGASAATAPYARIDQNPTGERPRWITRFEKTLLVGLSDKILAYNTLGFNVFGEVHSWYPTAKTVPARVRNFLYRVAPNLVDIEVIQTQFEYEGQQTTETVSKQLSVDFVIVDDPDSYIINLVADPLRHGLYAVTAGGKIFYGYTQRDGSVGWTEVSYDKFGAGSVLEFSSGLLFYNTGDKVSYIVSEEGDPVELDTTCSVEFLPLSVLKNAETPYLTQQGRTVRVSVSVKANDGDVIRLGSGGEFISEHTYEGQEIQDQITSLGDGAEGISVEYTGRGPFTVLRLAHDNVATDDITYSEPGSEG